MPGPRLIKETEEGKCEWLVSEAICWEETQLKASQLSRGTASDTQPSPSPVRSPPLAALLELLRSGSGCQVSGGEPMRDWQ